MDPVHGGGPWTRGPCFVLSPYYELGEPVVTSSGLGKKGSNLWWARKRKIDRVGKMPSNVTV